MKSLLTFIVGALLLSSTAYAADTVAWVKNSEGDKISLNLKEMKVRHIDNSIDEYIGLLGSDGSKLLLPLDSIEGIYKRGSSAAVKTRSGNEHIVPILPGGFPKFVGDNEFGGTTSFNLQHLSSLHFK